MAGLCLKRGITGLCIELLATFYESSNNQMQKTGAKDKTSP